MVPGLANLMNLTSLLILVVLSSPPLRQEGAAANEKQLKLDRQRARAVSMIEQVASEAVLWDNKKAAVEALAGAADLLWERSPARSAKWLTRAWELIDQVSEGQQEERFKEFFRDSQRSQLQTLVLHVAHSHDAKLADRFINQLKQAEPEEKKERGAFDDRSARSEQFLRLAQQVVNTNPELAFNLAQRSLADGLSFTLQNLLTSLRKKNAELANRLFDLALTRFSRQMSDPSEAEVLAGYLFQPGLTFSSNAAGQVIMVMNPMLRAEPAVATIEPQRAREFLVAAYNAFFLRPIHLDTPEAKQRAQRIWVFGNRNVGRYDTLAPEFAVPAKTYLAQLQTQLFPAGRGDPFSSGRQGSNETAKSRSEKEIYEARIALLEERAEKEIDPVKKKLAFVEAALATDASDYERAKRIAEKIAEEYLRSDTVSFVFYRAALSFVGKKEITKATELVPQIDHASRRAIVKMAIAQYLLTTKNDDKRDVLEAKVDEQQAFDLLTEVERDLRKEDPSTNAAKILLGRAALLAKLDPDQALIALQQSVQVINKLEYFDLKESSAPKLGISISARSQSLADSPRIGFTLRSAVEPLISVDFENITELAGSFKTKEVRGIGRLEVARLFLEKNK
jgi:hypothetical protein